MKKITLPFEYLFYRIYVFLQKQDIFPGLSKLEYRASAFVGFLLWMNLVSFLMLFDWIGLGEKKVSILFSLLFIILVSMIYFCRNEKLEKAEKEFYKVKWKALFDFLVIVYVLASAIFFGISAQL